MKKISYLTLLFILLGLVATTGCKKIDDGVNNPSIELSETELFIRSAGETNAIIVTASHPWKASSNQDWCKLSSTSGEAGISTFEIAIAPQSSDSYDERKAIITFIIGGSYKLEFNVTQRQQNALILSEKHFDLSSLSHEISITLQSNVDVDIRLLSSAKSWITYKTPSKALKESELKFEIAANLEPNIRETIIELLNAELNLSDTIYIRQDGANLFTADEFKAENQYGFYVSHDSMVLYDEAVDQMAINITQRMFRIQNYMQSRIFQINMTGEAIEVGKSIDTKVVTIFPPKGETNENEFNVKVLEVSGTKAKLWDDTKKRGFIVKYK